MYNILTKVYQLNYCIFSPCRKVGFFYFTKQKFYTEMIIGIVEEKDTR